MFDIKKTDFHDSWQKILGATTPRENPNNPLFSTGPHSKLSLYTYNIVNAYNILSNFEKILKLQHWVYKICKIL